LELLAALLLAGWLAAGAGRMLGMMDLLGMDPEQMYKRALAGGICICFWSAANLEEGAAAMAILGTCVVVGFLKWRVGQAKAAAAAPVPAERKTD
jgi:hypothetical protein